MRLKILVAVALLAPAAVWAQEPAAEPAPPPTDVVIVTASSAPASSSVLPTRGMNKSRVTREFGSPSTKRPTVGGGSPRQPPISRWDYDGFSVIFENDHVVDTVQRDHPASVKVLDGLAGGPQ